MARPNFHQLWGAAIGGGNIPAEDIPFLKERGMTEVFLAGTPIQNIADFIRKEIAARYQKKEEGDGG